MEIRGKTVLVVGMAKSGIAAAELLTKHGARVIACDSRPQSALPYEFRLQSREAFDGVDLIVLSPGVPLDSVPASSVPVIGDLELASRFLKGKTIGITGSNGKTTTTSMVFHILSHSGIAAQVGGNIGTPPASMVDTSEDGKWNVLELSSFQLETIHDFHAEIGICLNITPDHLDRHKTMEAYAGAKRRLFETQTNKDYAVLNADDAICSSFARHTPSNPVWFSLSRKAGWWLDGDVLRHESGVLMEAREIPVRGRHNVENTLAASAAAHLAGATLGQIRSAVMSFRAVEHRLEFVRQWRGIDFYNDSKATNVDAALKAVDAFHHGLWIVLGGKDKGSDYRPLREPLAKKARAALLIGAAAEKIAGQLDGAVELITAGDLSNAVSIAAEHAKSGETVLLAPACASFDQFENYEHRGRTFKSIVNGLE